MATLAGMTSVPFLLRRAVLINARLLVYSGGLAPLWAGTPLWAKVLGGASLVEPTWALAEQRRRTGPSEAPSATMPVQRHSGRRLAHGRLPWHGSGQQRRPGTASGGRRPVVSGRRRHPASAPARWPAAVLAGAATAVTARAVLPGSEVVSGMAAAAIAGMLGERHRS
jgi:predicted branched-subunit amino acid permease